MKKCLLFLMLVMFASTSARGQSRCLTPEFAHARQQLLEAFGPPRQATDDHSGLILHEVGDTMTFWAWDLTVMPPVWIQVPATCMEVTEYSYIFVADDQWNVNMDSSDIALVAYYWEEGTYNDSTAGIYDLDTENFGHPPDELDNDDHIYIFYSALGSFNGVVFDGYFSIFNEYTEEEAWQMGGHSNEVEMFYMSCYPGNPVSPIRISVLAHEFEHMIHWAHDPDEAVWVDEGCAEYAMLLFGVPDPLVDFPTQPDNDLTIWSNTFADYVQTFMFFTYLADHYGGPQTLTAVVGELQNSTQGIETVLGNLGYEETFADVFVNWAMANYYHGRGGDEVPEPDSLYLYFSIDPPAFSHSDSHNSYPVGPNNRHVNHWAADYVRFGNLENNPEVTVRFEGDNSADWGLALFTMGFPDWFGAERLIPDDDGVWEGAIAGPVLAGALMVTGLGSYGVTNYRYQAEFTTEVAEAADSPYHLSLGPSYPNPFNSMTTIRYTLAGPGYSRLSVFNLMGQEVVTLFEGRQEAGEHLLTWDASGLPSGIYYIRLAGDGYTESTGMILLK